MAIFVVVSQNQNQKLSEAITQAYPDNFFTLAPDQWIISTDALTKEVADKLNITGGDQGRVAVFKIETYYGWHDKNVWEWLELKNKK
jgi:hypothetical protein